MMKKTITRIFAVGILAALVALVGCTSMASPANEEQTANRAYMAQVNMIMDDLYAGLQDFTQTVSNNDIVGMRVQADRAFRTIEDLERLTPPENLEDLQAEYLAGCEALREALSDYIELYAEIDTAPEDQPFDYSTFGEEIDAIQSTYDEGIAYLESADTMATEL